MHMRHFSHFRTLIAAGVVALALTGCSSGSDTTASSSSAVPLAGTTDMDAPTGMPADADANPAARDAAAGTRVVVTDIRVGEHAGFDRVVFEFTGSGAPGWQVAYTDAATQPGSGAPVDVPGAAILSVTLTGTALPFEVAGAEEANADVAGVGSLTKVAWAANYEGRTQTFVGLRDGRRPFVVHALPNPTRVVVDIAR